MSVPLVIIEMSVFDVRSPRNVATKTLDYKQPEKQKSGGKTSADEQNSRKGD